MNGHDLRQPHQELRSLLGTRFSTDAAVRDAHARDASYHRGTLPDAVTFPKTNVEVSEIVKICAKYKIPIIPYGTGTGVEGAVVANEGALCISLNKMNRILSVNKNDRDAAVQAGVTRGQLNKHLDELGTRLHFPVDPGADASLGGMVATRASGTSAVCYGTMMDNVLGLTVITADGALVRTGSRARKSAAGYDLTRLFIGSEGTLGIITEITLKLARLPEAIAAAVCAFPTVADAVNTVIELMGAGVSVARIELLDELQMDAVNKYSGLDYEVAPTLFFEFHGSANTVAESSKVAGSIAAAHGSVISDMPQTKTNANDFGKPDMIVITLHLTVVPVLLVMLPMSVFRSPDLQSVLQRPNQSLRYPTFLHLCSVMWVMETSTLFFHLNPAIKMNWRKHNKSATRL